MKGELADRMSPKDFGLRVEFGWLVLGQFQAEIAKSVPVW
jgi:hypothetical protein